jgi:hypothetical protein
MPEVESIAAESGKHRFALSRVFQVRFPCRDEVLTVEPAGVHLPELAEIFAKKPAW